jgi:hypothetical protein
VRTVREGQGSEVEFVDKIQTKALRVFLLAIYSHLYSFALRFLFSSNSLNLLHISAVQLLYTVKEKEENLIESIPPSLCLMV